MGLSSVRSFAVVCAVAVAISGAIAASVPGGFAPASTPAGDNPSPFQPRPGTIELAYDDGECDGEYAPLGGTQGLRLTFVLADFGLTDPHEALDVSVYLGPHSEDFALGVAVRALPQDVVIEFAVDAFLQDPAGGGVTGWRTYDASPAGVAGDTFAVELSAVGGTGSVCLDTDTPPSGNGAIYDVRRRPGESPLDGNPIIHTVAQPVNRFGIGDVISTVESLPADVFRPPGESRRGALLEMLLAVKDKVGVGNFNGAAAQIENDILPKLTTGGASDWVRDDDVAQNVAVNLAMVWSSYGKACFGGSAAAYLAMPLNAIYGTTGADYIVGTSGGDLIFGGPGADVISGGGGDDVICTGPGDKPWTPNTAYGGDGKDALWGHDGRDTFLGGDGDDIMFAGNGDDTLFGGGGDDSMDGDDGYDGVYGGDGDDFTNGGAGDDVLVGGNGKDSVAGDGGYYPPWSPGLPGDDVMYGGPGPNAMVGGQGDDVFYGGDDGDSISAYDEPDGADTVFGGAGPDTISIGRYADVVFAGGGADTITGGGTVHGGEGDDKITGFDWSDDWLYGDEGDDKIVGGSGDDHLYGGPGDDYLGKVGDEWGDDVLDGGYGFDAYYAGTYQQPWNQNSGDYDTCYLGQGESQWGCEVIL